jgi:hypothetical protein
VGAPRRESFRMGREGHAEHGRSRCGALLGPPVMHMKPRRSVKHLDRMSDSCPEAISAANIAPVPLSKCIVPGMLPQSC